MSLTLSGNAFELVTLNPAALASSIAAALGLDPATIKNIRIVPSRRLASTAADEGEAEPAAPAEPADVASMGSGGGGWARRLTDGGVHIEFDIITDLATAGFATNDALLESVTTVP